jgi:hypothetical protein
MQASADEIAAKLRKLYNLKIGLAAEPAGRGKRIDHELKRVEASGEVKAERKRRLAKVPGELEARRGERGRERREYTLKADVGAPRGAQSACRGLSLAYRRPMRAGIHLLCADKA